jgi:hypothetical protein
MKHIDSETLKKLIYKKDKSKYKRPQAWHKVSIIRKSENPAYGIGIPKNTVEDFCIFGVYYYMKVEESGAKLIFESGCKPGEKYGEIII